MKTLFGIAIFLLTSSLWADWPDRIVELGVHAEAHVGNNYFPVTAFFNNPLVIDLNNMASTLGDSGLLLPTSVATRVYLTITPSKFVQGGLSWGTEVYGLTSVPGALISLLANGNGSSSSSTTSGTWDPQTLKGDVYTDLGVWAGVTWNKWHFIVRPAYYVPLLHIGNINATYSITTSPTGGTTATTQANIPVYGAFPLPNSSTSNYQPLNHLDIGQMLNDGGFDFSAEAEYSLFPWLSVGGLLKNLPLVPGHLSQSSLLQTTQTVTTVDPSTNSGNPLLTTSTYSWNSSTCSVSVIRPFEARAKAILYPFKDPWLSITPTLGIGVWNNPYLDGGLLVTADLRHWAYFQLNSDYQYGLWSQTFGMGFNVRLFELDLALGGTSTDFVKSFTDGVTAAVDVKLGF